MPPKKLIPVVPLKPNGDVILKFSNEAREIKEKYKHVRRMGHGKQQPLPSATVAAKAKQAVLCKGGDTADDVTVLSHYQLQFGQYFEKTFCWLVENDPGYAVYLWIDAEREAASGTPTESKAISANLKSLTKFLAFFDPLRKLKEMTTQTMAAKEAAKKSGDEGLQIIEFGKYRGKEFKWVALSDDRQHLGYVRWLVKKSDVQPNTGMWRLQQYLKKLHQSSSAEGTSADGGSSLAGTTSQHPLSPPTASTAPPSASPPSIKSPSTTPSVRDVPPSATGSSALPLSAVPPSATLPSVTLPSVTLPSVTLPSVTLPSVTPPSVTPPSVTPPSVTPQSATLPSATLPSATLPSATSSSAAPQVPSQTDAPCPPTSSREDAQEQSDQVYMYAQKDRRVAHPDPPAPTNTAGLAWQHIVSPAQERWMRRELQKLGLLPGTAQYNQPSRWEGEALWRTPPPGELQPRKASALPVPDYFWLHSMFLWFPATMLKGIAGPNGLPCITQNCSGTAQPRGLGRPRVVVGRGGGNTGMVNTGQYYIMSGLMYCKRCKCSPWYADNPLYLAVLPHYIKNMFPAHITFRKAVCRSLVDQMRRSGRSPADVAGEVKELLKLRYERAHHQYLLLLSQVRSQAASGTTLEESVGLDMSQASVPFGSYECSFGYRGVAVSEYFLADTLIAEYKEQRPFLYGMLKGTFGRFWRSDHTRTVAKKVELLSGSVWSYCTLNEYWEAVSWVMVDTDSEAVLGNYYSGLSRRYVLANVEKASLRWVDRWCCVSPPTSLKKPEEPTPATNDLDWEAWVADGRRDPQTINTTSHRTTSGLELSLDRRPFARKSACRVNYNEEIEELLDAFHCIRRLGRACISESHPAYGRFMSLLSSAFFIIDEEDLTALRRAYRKLGREGEPTKKEVRRHCRTRIPPSEQLQQRVEAVLKTFMTVEDMGGVRLFTSRMLPEWKLQRTHIQRGCLSDPLVMPSDDSSTVLSGGVPYRLASEIYLGGIVSPETKLCVWQPMRGSSQLEGFHLHQCKWVTGTRVSPALFQAQCFFGVGRWNWKRAVEHRNLCLPVFDPRLTAELNISHLTEYGTEKYPDFNCTNSDTGELFGLDYCQDQSRAMQQQMDTICLIPDAPQTEIVHSEPAAVNEMESPSEIDGVLEAGVDVEVQGQLAVVLGGGDLSEVIGPQAQFRQKGQQAQVEFEEVELPALISEESVPASPKRGREFSEGSSDSSPESKRPRLSSAAKRSAREELRRSVFAGRVAYWPPDKWTADMKDVINGLLVKIRGKQRMSRVVEAYQKLVLDQATDMHSRLHMTNRCYIQAYERGQHRVLERSAAVGSDEIAASVEDTTKTLETPAQVPSHIVAPDTAQVSSRTPQVEPAEPERTKQRPKWKRHEQQSTSQPVAEPEPTQQIPTTTAQSALLQTILTSVLASIGIPQGAGTGGPSGASRETPPPAVPKPKRIRHKDPKSGSNIGGRNCMYCGGPKGRLAGEGNLHYTYIKRGETGYFYCPKKVAAEYGIPETTTFEEFKASLHWESAMEKVREEKAEKERKKEEAAARRAEKGWKKPGVPPKDA